jgi:four helix bundle protein
MKRLPSLSRTKLQAPTSNLQRSSNYQIPILDVKAKRNTDPIINSAWDAHARESSSSASLIMKDEPPANGNRHPFDLEERTAVFGESIIAFAKQIPRSALTNRLIDQLIGSATSVGANYREANESVSKRDFKCRIGICRKEAKETMFFLRMIVAAHPPLRDEARKLWIESKELDLIFCAIYRK